MAVVHEASLFSCCLIYVRFDIVITVISFMLSFACGFSYVLGAVETFLKAVPAAGIFRGNNETMLHLTVKNFSLIYFMDITHTHTHVYQFIICNVSCYFS